MPWCEDGEDGKGCCILKQEQRDCGREYGIVINSFAEAKERIITIFIIQYYWQKEEKECWRDNFIL